MIDLNEYGANEAKDYATPWKKTSITCKPYLVIDNNGERI